MRNPGHCSVSWETGGTRENGETGGNGGNGENGENGENGGKEREEKERGMTESELARAFESEPLKGVDLTEVKRQRTRKEVIKIMRFLVSKKQVLSDGRLDYTSGSAPKHTRRARFARR